VDVTNMTSSSFEERMAVAKKVGRVCSDVGFFCAQNHPVPQDVVEKTFEVIMTFFSQSEEVKTECPHP
jgi:isopenicillin N synthase-like dioxygenase